MSLNNIPYNTTVKKIEVDEFLIKNRMPYFYYTIIMRAIPYWFDGLKPSHRRILYSLYEANVLYDKKRIKGKKADGLAGAYNPHGSLYKAIARLSRKDTCMLPLLDPKGNMGLHNAKGINESADRYTSFRLSEYSTDMFKNINKGVVPFQDNYDESAKEPVYLVPEIPNILVNPNIGVANGFATKICSYNLGDVCDQTYNSFLNKEIETMTPDFATKGFIVNDENLFEKIMNTGTGSILLRARYHKEGNTIVVTELPYLTKIEEVEGKIVSLMKANKLKEVLDVHNYTDREGLRLEIDCRRNTDLDDLMIKLYKLTKLESSFPCNMTVLYNNRPIKLGTRSIIERWTNHKLKIEQDVLNINLKKIKDELHVLYSFKKISDDINKTISIITTSENEESALSKLKEEFDLSEVQSKHICSIRAITLNKDYIGKQIKKIKELEDKCKKIQYMLDNECELRKLLANRVMKFKDKYDTNRKCEIIEVANEEVKKTESILIEDYNCQIQISKESYFKKTKLTGLNSANNKLKDGDEILSTITCTNKDEVLLFAEDLNCYKIKLHELEETKLSNIGEYMNSKIKQTILGMGVVSDQYKYVMVVYNDGNFAKIKMDSYKTMQNRQSLSGSLRDSDVFGVYMLEDDCEVKFTVTDGREKIFNTNELTAKKARNSGGTKMQKWKNVKIKNIEIIK